MSDPVDEGESLSEYSVRMLREDFLKKMGECEDNDFAHVENHLVFTKACPNILVKPDGDKHTLFCLVCGIISSVSICEGTATGNSPKQIEYASDEDEFFSKLGK